MQILTYPSYYRRYTHFLVPLYSTTITSDETISNLISLFFKDHQGYVINFYQCTRMLYSYRLLNRHFGSLEVINFTAPNVFPHYHGTTISLNARLNPISSRLFHP